MGKDLRQTTKEDNAMKVSRVLSLIAIVLILMLQSCDFGVARITGPYIVTSMEICEYGGVVKYRAYSVNCTKAEKLFCYFDIIFMDSIGKYNYGDTVVIVKTGK